MEKQFEKIIITKFRGLKNIELSEIGNINLLVGSNNSGKTSILESISTYCRPLDPMEWLNTGWRREIKSSRIPMLDALKWLFPQTADCDPESLYKGETLVSASGNFDVIEVSADYKEILGTVDITEPEKSSEDDEFPYNPDDIRRGADLTLTASVRDSSIFDSKESFSEKFQIWENERFVKRRISKEYTLPVATVTPFSHRVEPLQVKQFTDAAFKDVIDNLIDIANQIDRGIKEIKVLDKTGMRSTLYIKHDKIGLAPISAFGDGVRRTLMMALNLALVENGILLIDEIETSIHISALKTVFEWLVKSCAKLNVQVFATTHSLEAIDAILSADKESTENLVVYRLPMPETENKVKRFGEDLLYRLRYERGMDVR